VTAHAGVDRDDGNEKMNEDENRIGGRGDLSAERGRGRGRGHARGNGGFGRSRGLQSRGQGRGGFDASAATSAPAAPIDTPPPAPNSNLKPIATALANDEAALSESGDSSDDDGPPEAISSKLSNASIDKGDALDPDSVKADTSTGGGVTTINLPQKPTRTGLVDSPKLAAGAVQKPRPPQPRKLPRNMFEPKTSLLRNVCSISLNLFFPHSSQLISNYSCYQMRSELPFQISHKQSILSLAMTSSRM
jgi:hypothetical protein